MKRLYFLCVILILAASLTLVGCSSKSTPAAGDGKESKENIVNIGFIGPLTGPSAYIGLDSLHGAQTAAWEVNQNGGFEVGGKRYKLNIVSYDDEMVAAKSVAGLRKLADEHNIKMAINNLSGTIMALLKVNEEMGVLLGGFFRIPDATTLGNKLVLRHQSTTLADSSLEVNKAIEIMKPNSVAILADVSDYGRSTEKVWASELKNLGVNVVASEWFDMTKETDLRPQLSKIKASNPDIVMVAAYDEGSATARKQAVELGLKIPFVFTLGLQDLGIKTIGPEKLEGSGRLVQYDMLTPTPTGVKNYNSLHEKLTKQDGWKEKAGAYGGNVYEYVWTLVYAMQKAGTVDDVNKIREAAPKVFPLPEEHFYIGVIGYDPVTGNGSMQKYFGLFKNGELVPVK